MIDGTVARKTKSASEFGAKLDTVSDFVFMIVALIRFVPHLNIPTWLWMWIGIIAMMKLGGAVWGFVRTGKLAFPHTILNKVTGLLLFLLPVTISFVELTYTLPIVCAVATVAENTSGIIVFDETYKINNEYAKELIINARGNQTGHREAVRFIEDTFGSGYITERNRYESNVWKDGRRERANSGTHNSRTAIREWRFDDEQEQQRSEGLTDREVLELAANEVKVSDLSQAENDALTIFKIYGYKTKEE